MGLSPKPNINYVKKYSMEDLNNYLQSHFSKEHTGSYKEANIDIREYIPSKEEILIEAHKAGYETREDGNILYFK